MPRSSRAFNASRASGRLQAGVQWTVEPIVLGQAFAALGARLVEAVEHDVAEPFAKDLETFAKANHPWQNRTGAAERELKGSVTSDAKQVVITLAHGVDYGVWLEVRWAGKYAIILPTLESNYGELMQRLSHLI